MTLVRRLAVAILTATLLFAANAGAAPLLISGGTSYTTLPPSPPGDWRGNDVFPNEPGYVGAQLQFQGTAGKSYRFTFEFLGYEALWVDGLETSAGDISNRAPSRTSLSLRWLATGGLDTVPFSFITGDDPGRRVRNGENPFPTLGLPSFFLSVATPDGRHGTGLRSGSTVWLGLDDAGAGPDADFDDWVGTVRVPEPLTLVLLGIGLVAAAARRRHG